MSPAARIIRELHWRGTISLLRALLTCSARVRGPVPSSLPPTGGFILACNHISHFDPPLLTVNFPRRIDWIAMSELFRGPVLQRFFSGLNVIPVDRHGTDRTALRTAATRLRQGRIVGIFPEGGIRDGSASVVHGGPMKEGVALLASLSDAPIVPCVILGSDRLYHRRYWLGFRRAPVWIACGPPLTAPADLPTAEKRALLRSALASAFPALRKEMETKFSLNPSDLPHPPPERMREGNQ